MKKTLLFAFAAACGLCAMADDDVEYASIGSAEYQDGLLLSCFGITTETWLVDIQQCTTDENLYRLANPYIAETCPVDFEAAGLTIDPSAATEYWYLNATNPDAVKPTTYFYTGIYNGETAISMCYDSRYSENFTFSDGVFTSKPYSIYTYYGTGSSDWAYYTTIIYLPGAEKEVWSKKCDAMFTDGFWCMYTDTEAQSWEVEVYESNKQEGVIRVENPYTASTCPLDYGDAEINSSADAYWEIKVADPDAVKQVETYFCIGVDLVGGYPIFFYNSTAGTMIDNKIVFPAGNIYAWYIYSSSSYTALNEFVIDLNGSSSIADIEAANDAAPVYYNLQGMRIAEPKAGQVAIMRQGNKVTKIVK
ncbi:MAG: hypothetical protein LIP03_08880 [Bacteroidales bacterium]|nr:hypothetical protein [Bacteroidales bacterium]